MGNQRFTQDEAAEILGKAPQRLFDYFTVDDLIEIGRRDFQLSEADVRMSIEQFLRKRHQRRVALATLLSSIVIVVVVLLTQCASDRPATTSAPASAAAVSPTTSAPQAVVLPTTTEVEPTTTSVETTTTVAATTTTASVQMPDVVGLAEARALEVLTQAGLENVLVGSEQSEAPIGTVVSQEPAPGTSMPPDGEVRVRLAIPITHEVPDLAGLTQAEAEVALRSAGFDNLSFSSVDSLQTAGLVVGVEPRSGASVELETLIDVSIASSVPTPDAALVPVDDIRELLEGLGGTLTVTSGYFPGRQAGEVVEQAPVPGVPLTAEMFVALAVAPAEVKLEALDSVENRCDCGYSIDFGTGAYNGSDEAGFDRLDIDGTTYDSALFLNAVRLDERDRMWVDFNIGRDFDRFVAIVGYEDNSPSDGLLQAEILDQDLNLLWSNVFSIGRSEPVAIDVTDVLRLRFQVINLRSRSRGAKVIGIGDGRLLGDPAQVRGYGS